MYFKTKYYFFTKIPFDEQNYTIFLLFMVTDIFYKNTTHTEIKWKVFIS